MPQPAAQPPAVPPHGAAVGPAAGPPPAPPVAPPPGLPGPVTAGVRPGRPPAGATTGPGAGGPGVPAPLVRRILPPLAVLCTAAGAFTYVGLVDPNEAGHYPLCPLFAVTGIYCPGCGGLRSAHAVANGDLATALGDNALAVLGFAVFAVLWVRWMITTAKALPLRITLRPAWWWALGGVVAAFSVLRNLPLGSSLAP